MVRVDLPFNSRRRFVRGVAALGALPLASLSHGQTPLGSARPNVLRGRTFDLTIDEVPINITGRPRIATAINGSVPAPELRWREGDTIALNVTNRLSDTSSIHWHGIILPFRMDGVPGLSFDGIAPGETYHYRFKVEQSGTYWYHSHSRFQEQTGMYGPIVVEPRNAERDRSDREHVIVLSDWTDDDPERIFSRLKQQADYYNFIKPTAVDFLRDVQQIGIQAAYTKRRMWNRMRMNPTDLSDLTGDTYTYLINGLPPAANWTGLFRPRERVRLRIVNASAQTIFDLRIPGLKLTVVSADGQDVEPVTVEEIRIAVAETYDVMIEPLDDRAYTFFAQSIDRGGYARATLAPRQGMQADVPEVDEPHWLSMVDMMGAMTLMGGMSHDAMRAGNTQAAVQAMQDTAGRPNRQADRPGNDHRLLGRNSAMGHEAMGDKSDSGMTKPSMPRARHARTEYGVTTDMRVDMPRNNIDDPGVGLRENGRRVLTYADLHTVGGPLDERGAGREIELHLTGNMERYIWSFDGQRFADSRPIHLRYGERVRIILVNDSMMPHPIHLHGLWSEMESPDQKFQVRKHTIMVQPAQRISYLVTADALGNWAYHCHLLYHLEAGMFREVRVTR